MCRYFVAGLLLIALCLHGSDGLSCPSGFEVHGNSCYFFSHGKETWNGAFESCKLFSAKLVEVNDANENNYLSHKTDNLDDDWWIGLTDKLLIGEYVWETSKTILSAGDFTFWAAGEPDAGDDENCIYFGSSKKNMWADSACSNSKYYICEIDGGLSGTIIG